MAETFNVSLDMLTAIDVIDKAVVEKSWGNDYQLALLCIDSIRVRWYNKTNTVCI